MGAKRTKCVASRQTHISVLQMMIASAFTSMTHWRKFHQRMRKVCFRTTIYFHCRWRNCLRCRRNSFNWNRFVSAQRNGFLCLDAWNCFMQISSSDWKPRWRATRARALQSLLLQKAFCGSTWTILLEMSPWRGEHLCWQSNYSLFDMFVKRAIAISLNFRSNFYRWSNIFLKNTKL